MTDQNIHGKGTCSVCDRSQLSRLEDRLESGETLVEGAHPDSCKPAPGIRAADSVGWEERFDAEFLCHEPGHEVMSDHQFAHDKRGVLVPELKKFIRTVVDETRRRYEAYGYQEAEAHYEYDEIPRRVREAEEKIRRTMDGAAPGEHEAMWHQSGLKIGRAEGRLEGFDEAVKIVAYGISVQDQKDLMEKRRELEEGKC
jgi:hypothetical protein